MSWENEEIRYVSDSISHILIKKGIAMKYLTILLLFIISCADNPVSSNDDDLTKNAINRVVCLWHDCYSIETTTELNLCGENAGYYKLTGSIPPAIGNLVNLTHIDLSMNELTGEIPKEIGNLTNLTFMALDSNNLTGEIPEEVCILVENNDLHIVIDSEMINTCDD